MESIPTDWPVIVSEDTRITLEFPETVRKATKGVTSSPETVESDAPPNAPVAITLAFWKTGLQNVFAIFLRMRDPTAADLEDGNN